MDACAKHLLSNCLQRAPGRASYLAGALNLVTGRGRVGPSYRTPTEVGQPSSPSSQLVALQVPWYMLCAAYRWAWIDLSDFWMLMGVYVPDEASCDVALSRKVIAPQKIPTLLRPVRQSRSHIISHGKQL